MLRRGGLQSRFAVTAGPWPETESFMPRRKKETASHSEEPAAAQSERPKKSRSKAKPGPKLKKRRSAPRGRPREEKTDPPTPDGEGARLLLSSVNTRVAQESDRIAEALVTGTVKGSASHARLVVGLSGAGALAPSAAPAVRESGGSGFTAADLPGSEDNWELDLEPEARPGYTPPKS
jgi:hypothetical protein